MTSVAPSRWWRRLPWTFGSGAEVASAFHRALALVFLVAWLSLAAQVRVLIGAHGLLPLAELVEAARSTATDRLAFRAFPSWLVLAPRDGVLAGGAIAGVGLALLALAGVATRLCVALQTFLYLGYAVACRSFLGFQWDNLLIEAGTLATFLPAGRPAPVAHFLFRALLFKLYFESGLAKWQSPNGDWRDGSAMTFYYQTAPLPTALAWFAHHLPAGWHHFESRATLVLELAVPFAVFGPRRARLCAAVALTSFQIVNAATANYGVFCYLSAALHLFLLDDADVQRWHVRIARIAPAVSARLARVAAWRPSLPSPLSRLHPPRLLLAWRPRAVTALVALGAAAWVTLSLTEAAFVFGGIDPASGAARPLTALLELEQPFRLVNTYHLFAAVTRERIEPEVQVEAEPGQWQALDLKYKPGSIGRPPPLVAPHQPRVDFLLWFYGLSFTRRQPAYVTALLDRLCADPSAVASIFERTPPLHVLAVRIAFWDYRFTTPAERRASSAWWVRRYVGAAQSIPCSPSP
jgi:hypothetical protein